MSMERVAVNGAEIAPAIIDAELQNHRAESAEAARIEATRALVVRELLLQEARRIELAPPTPVEENGIRDTEEEALIGLLLDDQIDAPPVDDAACRTYYQDHPDRFLSPDLFEPAHILLSADPSDTDAYQAAETRAETIIKTVLAAPQKFADMAREHSDCSSARDGGALGQVAPGQTAPEFETFLCALEEGQICPVPVKSRYGVHVLRLDRRENGRTLPFEAVRDKIAVYLEETNWRRSVHDYIGTLASRAEIEGMHGSLAD
jgi:peptidyl-prolyl cis-trans isomerase C